jgi:hypothetical protein
MREVLVFFKLYRIVVLDSALVQYSFLLYLFLFNNKLKITNITEFKTI